MKSIQIEEVGVFRVIAIGVGFVMAVLIVAAMALLGIVTLLQLLG
ncbi:MAG TPA: hypothetical protein VKB18_07390 [Gemmatimonadota bacterium]|nr:hypothetical protein [Gemmatimonadota bacterium]